MKFIDFLRLVPGGTLVSFHRDGITETYKGYASDLLVGRTDAPVYRLYDLSVSALFAIDRELLSVILEYPAPEDTCGLIY